MGATEFYDCFSLEKTKTTNEKNHRVLWPVELLLLNVIQVALTV
jgi:hypothetical protein